PLSVGGEDQGLAVQVEGVREGKGPSEAHGLGELEMLVDGLPGGAGEGEPPGEVDGGGGLLAAAAGAQPGDPPPGRPETVLDLDPAAPEQSDDRRAALGRGGDRNPLVEDLLAVPLGVRDEAREDIQRAASPSLVVDPRIQVGHQGGYAGRHGAAAVDVGPQKVAAVGA